MPKPQDPSTPLCWPDKPDRPIVGFLSRHHDLINELVGHIKTSGRTDMAQRFSDFATHAISQVPRDAEHRPQVPDDVLFLPLSWLSEDPSSTLHEFATRWFDATLTPAEAAQKWQNICNMSDDLMTPGVADGLWRVAKPWMTSEPARIARGLGLSHALFMLQDFTGPMKVERQWLKRLLNSSTTFPSLAFAKHELGHCTYREEHLVPNLLRKHPEVMKEVGDALERRFGLDLVRQEASAQFMAVDDKAVRPRENGWITALMRGWLDAPCAQKMFTSPALVGPGVPSEQRSVPLAYALVLDQKMGDTSSERVMQALFDLGVNPDQPFQMHNGKSKEKSLFYPMTVLCCAVQRARSNIVKLTIQRGANVQQHGHVLNATDRPQPKTLDLHGLLHHPIIGRPTFLLQKDPSDVRDIGLLLKAGQAKLAVNALLTELQVSPTFAEARPRSA